MWKLGARTSSSTLSSISSSFLRYWRYLVWHGSTILHYSSLIPCSSTFLHLCSVSLSLELQSNQTPIQCFLNEANSPLCRPCTLSLKTDLPSPIRSGHYEYLSQIQQLYRPWWELCIQLLIRKTVARSSISSVLTGSINSLPLSARKKTGGIFIIPLIFRVVLKKQCLQRRSVQPFVGQFFQNFVSLEFISFQSPT